MNQKLLLSFSGGATSAIMTDWCLKNLADEYNMIVVFANTGKEKEETLEFVDKCDKYFGFNVIWVEGVWANGIGTRHKIVNFKTASRNGEPFESMIARHGIPNSNSPHCTRELKSYPIKSLARSMGWTKYKTAIGIRTDEADRINESGDFIYPLLSKSMNPMSKEDVNIFWDKMPFKLGLKGYEGNCNKCWKKSLRKLMTIEKEERINGNRDNWWDEMETKYGNYVPESRIHNDKIILPLHFYRGNFSSKDIEEASLQDFIMAKDDSKISNQLKFDWSAPIEHKLFIDESNGCSESCEVF
jgi:hypothetical protein